jgi:hypothetical protein
MDYNSKIVMLKGEKGESINSIEKTSSSGLKDTYTITLNDGTTSTFAVTNGANGASIENIAKTGTNGLVDTYTITLSDGATSTFTVTNGKDGDGAVPPLATETSDGLLSKEDKKTINSLGSVASILNKAYPVGSIYMSVNNTSPATLFGGTWEAIEGRFLLGVDSTYSAGSTGGEATHTLTKPEMPSHKHLSHFFFTKAETPNNTYGLTDNGAFGNRVLVYTEGTNPHDGYIYAEGGTEAHNNMPPYLAVYMWKRTA